MKIQRGPTIDKLVIQGAAFFESEAMPNGMTKEQKRATAHFFVISSTIEKKRNPQSFLLFLDGLSVSLYKK
jgi:hypothetical protein